MLRDMRGPALKTHASSFARSRRLPKDHANVQGLKKKLAVLDDPFVEILSLRVHIDDLLDITMLKLVLRNSTSFFFGDGLTRCRHGVKKGEELHKFFHNPQD